MNLNYLGLVRRAPHCWIGRIPDLPGCCALGHEWEEMPHLLAKAASIHLAHLLDAGTTPPAPSRQVSVTVPYPEAFHVAPNY